MKLVDIKTLFKKYHSSDTTFLVGQGTYYRYLGYDIFCQLRSSFSFLHNRTRLGNTLGRAFT